MKSVKSWRFLKRNSNSFSDGVSSGPKMKQLQLLGIICTAMLFIVYRTIYYQYKQTEMEEEINPFDIVKDLRYSSINSLPHGIVQPRSDLELKPLWSTSGSRSKASVSTTNNLLAIAVGIKLKDNVDTIVQKFLAENFTVILFHYDGNVDGWGDLDWSNKAAHIVAQNQTKWWFAKRFLHPDIVAAYDYIFLWDEDLGVENFDPRRKVLGLYGVERICTRNTYILLKRKDLRYLSQRWTQIQQIYIINLLFVQEQKSFTGQYGDMLQEESMTAKAVTSVQVLVRDHHAQGNFFFHFYSCFSFGPLLFFRAYLWKEWLQFFQDLLGIALGILYRFFSNFVQNDLVHGWGMDMKFGYCAQGDRTKNIGVIDSEYVVHQGIQTLGGGPPTRKPRNHEDLSKKHTPPDLRAEIRRQSTWELEMFKKRWNKAIEGDKAWVDPYRRIERHRSGRERPQTVF
ncbi:hypothetical protein EZV62_026617 [Acer yangbiense]|uniref:Uncharacterized protein n=1 Tax=Acer yangbiense TaxID=1000413 RepID=A0A5C7GRS1_9ROSI|nr:hypothetical protein EZV62_026617 [Acer yangbiense]